MDVLIRTAFMARTIEDGQVIHGGKSEISAILNSIFLPQGAQRFSSGPRFYRKGHKGFHASPRLTA
jgi:hypothetical protein